jgi:hypothetical protein
MKDIHEYAAVLKFGFRWSGARTRLPKQYLISSFVQQRFCLTIIGLFWLLWKQKYLLSFERNK